MKVVFRKTEVNEGAKWRVGGESKLFLLSVSHDSFGSIFNILYEITYGPLIRY